MKWNEMKWNEMKWNEMKWNEMKWNEMKWNEMKWNEMKWNEMKWNEMKWNEMKCNFTTANPDTADTVHVYVGLKMLCLCWVVEFSDNKNKQSLSSIDFFTDILKKKITGLINWNKKNAETQ
jgi:hypothetical protein